MDHVFIYLISCFLLFLVTCFLFVLLTFFPFWFTSPLSFRLRIGLLRFQVGSRNRQLNLVLVYFVLVFFCIASMILCVTFYLVFFVLDLLYIFCSYFSWFLILFLSTRQEIGWGNDLFCVKWDLNLNSINQSSISWCLAEGSRNKNHSHSSWLRKNCFLAQDRLCHDVSVHLSVMEVHWRTIANLGFKFRSKFTAHCGRGEG